MNLFNMGGYGFYVWTAFGITFAVFGINVALFFWEKKQVKQYFHESQTKNQTR